ncbi:hypothetical protein O181_002567 [Austropuccinia psidii MF-1]|uniref:Uncharacterized protein n=1 Tax=Austropuccinia psidii MF-1 TaxID=1389203 RepID=A0A9Q3GE33_9BASI|nr:hypothetical protein [Austropuccinia psidii MF-1]
MATRSRKLYQQAMSSSTAKFDLNYLKTALISANETDTRICKRLETERSGQSIAPHLARDSYNFRQWSRSLCLLINNILDNKLYFELTLEDEIKTQNNAVQTFILRSIDECLLSFVEDIASTR